MASAPASAVRSNKGDSADLPEFIVLKSPNTNKYLGYRTDRDYRGFLRFDYDDIWSPYVKFQVVKDKETGFISLKCCYNNKFLKRQDADSFWIVAGEASANTDQSSPSCTLFEMVYDPKSETHYLRMVQCNKCVADWRVEGGQLDRCLFAGEDPGREDVFARLLYYSMDGRVRLPKRVCFKADNGKYLGYETVGNLPWILLFNGSSAADEKVAQTVQWTADGKMNFISNKTTQLWRPSSYDSVTVMPLFIGQIGVYEAFKVDEKTVALYSVTVGKFGKRFTGSIHDRDFVDALIFNQPTVDSATRLVVEEPAVVSRTVSSIEYDLDSAFISGLTPLLLGRARGKNDTADPAVLDVPISCTVSSTQSWNNSFTVGGSVETTFKTGIPIIAEGEITVSVETSYSHEWGGEVTKETTFGANYSVTVPAGKTVVVDAVATQGTCELKFSYVQRDYLNNGSVVETALSDGAFKGVNAYDFYYHAYIQDAEDAGGAATREVFRTPLFNSINAF